MAERILAKAREVRFLWQLARESARDAWNNNEYARSRQWVERTNRLYRAWLRLLEAATLWAAKEG